MLLENNCSEKFFFFFSRRLRIKKEMAKGKGRTVSFHTLVNVKELSGVKSPRSLMRGQSCLNDRKANRRQMTNSKVIKTLVCPALTPRAYKVQMSRLRRQRIAKILGSKTTLTRAATNSIIQGIKMLTLCLPRHYSIHQVTFLNNEK